MPPPPSQASAGRAMGNRPLYAAPPGLDDRQRYSRGISPAAIDLLRRRAVIGVLGFEDVGDVGLRVAVDQRKPTALDLHHDPMALLEAVIAAVQVDHVLLDLARLDGRG